jgi:C4-dicarboxylate transporter DctM subunit
MNEITIGVIGVIILVGLFLTGLEMAFAMAIVGVLGYAIVVSPEAAMYMLPNDFADTLESYPITAVPLFMLMGQIVFNAGIARRLYDAAHKFLGHIPGGLALATVVGATAFKAMCGSMTATCATFAGVAVPEMDRYGYAKKLSTGIVASVGVLGMLIPPAGSLIFLGIITQQSIGKLFLAGLVPGLLLAVCFICVILGWARINPSIGPKSDKYTWKARVKSLPELIWPLLIFVIIIGGLMKGVMTPTEAGAVGAFCVFVLAIVKRDINFAGIKQSTSEALKASSMVILLIASSTMLGRFITATDIPTEAAQFVAALPFHRHATLSIIFLVYLLGGTFMDDLAFMILATPIFFPSMVNLGYDPIWLCIMISVVIGLGSIIPPIAMCVFIVQQVAKVPISVVYAGVYPFLLSLFLLIVLLFMFPQIALYLPSTFMK